MVLMIDASEIQRLTDARDYILSQVLCHHGMVLAVMYLSPSRFAAAVGICRFTSRAQLWRRMKGLEAEQQENPACVYGTQTEPVAIQAYETLTGNKVHPAPSIHELNHYPTRAGTADGLLNHNGIIEVKSPYSMILTKNIRPEYWTQVQGYLEYYDRDFCDFIIYTPFAMVVHRAFRDRYYWQQLLRRLVDFMDCLKQDHPPRKMKRGEKSAAMEEIEASMRCFCIPLLFSKCFFDNHERQHRKHDSKSDADCLREHKRSRTRPYH